MAYIAPRNIINLTKNLYPGTRDQISTIGLVSLVTLYSHYNLLEFESRVYKAFYYLPNLSQDSDF